LGSIKFFYPAAIVKLTCRYCRTGWKRAPAAVHDGPLSEIKHDGPLSEIRIVSSQSENRTDCSFRSARRPRQGCQSLFSCLVPAMGSLLDSILKSRKIRVNRFGAGRAPARSRSRPNGARFRLTPRRTRSMFDFHGGCLAGGKNDALGHMIDFDAHGN